MITPEQYKRLNIKRRKRSQTPATRAEQEVRWAQERSHAQRLKDLDVLITEDDLRELLFPHLVAVGCGGGDECHLYFAETAETNKRRTAQFKPAGYKTLAFHGYTIGVHVFSYAASHGVTIASLCKGYAPFPPFGYHIHHEIKDGGFGCWGYRCAYISHLHKVQAESHYGTQGEKGSRAPLELKLMQAAIELPPRERHSAGGSRNRVFPFPGTTGLGFDIRLGTVIGIVHAEPIILVEEETDYGRKATAAFEDSPKMQEHRRKFGAKPVTVKPVESREDPHS